MLRFKWKDNHRSEYYTFMSYLGKSVNDYMIVNHDAIKHFNNFEVITKNDCIEYFNLFQLLSDVCKFSDHSVLVSEMNYSSY